MIKVEQCFCSMCKPKTIKSFYVNVKALLDLILPFNEITRCSIDLTILFKRFIKDNKTVFNGVLILYKLYLTIINTSRLRIKLK